MPQSMKVYLYLYFGVSHSLPNFFDNVAFFYHNKSSCTDFSLLYLSQTQLITIISYLEASLVIIGGSNGLLLLGCGYQDVGFYQAVALLCKHGALRRQSLEPSHEKCAQRKTLPKQSKVRSKARARLRARQVLWTLEYIYIYVCMCHEVVRGRTGCVLMD